MKSDSLRAATLLLWKRFNASVSMTSLTVTEMDSIKSPDVGHFFFGSVNVRWGRSCSFLCASLGTRATYKARVRRLVHPGVTEPPCGTVVGHVGHYEGFSHTMGWNGNLGLPTGIY